MFDKYDSYIFYKTDNFDTNDSEKIEGIINNEITKETKEKLKDSILEMVNKGINISDKNMYESIKTILSKLNIVELCPFEEIEYKNSLSLFNVSYLFSMKLEGNKASIFPATESAGFGTFDPRELGHIKDGKFTPEIKFKNGDSITDNNEFNLELHINNNEKKDQEENIENDTINSEQIKKDNNKVTVEENNIEESLIKDISKTENNNNNNNNNNNQIEKKKTISTQEYIVQKGDTLWAIVKEKYGLIRYRDIANAINKLVDYNLKYNDTPKDINIDNTPDGIKGDKIYVGQKIIVPSELKFRDQIFKINK